MERNTYLFGQNFQKETQLLKMKKPREIMNDQNLGSKTRRSCSKINILSRRGEKQKKDDSPTLHLGSLVFIDF